MYCIVSDNIKLSRFTNQDPSYKDIQYCSLKSMILSTYYSNMEDELFHI